jgi:branched-chain amino acid aminotransferase
MDQELMASGAAWMDGDFVPIDQATISVLDFGFTRSDVTYDVVHVWDGSFFRLEHHLDRFLRSVAALRMALPFDRDGLRNVLMGCVQRTGLRDAYVAMFCTRGRPPAGVRDLRQCRNRFVAYALPFIWLADRERQMKGINAIVPQSVRRIPPEAVDPTVKNYHWLDLDRGLLEAYEKGADTAILLGTDGTVTEGPGFNVFVVFGDRIATPDRGVLEGITRGTIIDICRKEGRAVEVRPIPEAEFRDADEIFVTSTAGGVIPIVRLDERYLGNGAPGATTMRLRELYWAWHHDPAQCTPVEYAAATAV